MSEDRELLRHCVGELQQLWADAVKDELPGLSADEVLNDLERKYFEMVREIRGENADTDPEELKDMIDRPAAKVRAGKRSNWLKDSNT